MQDPKVSILCTTYNQESYIEQALEGFINQKTNFEFEILIHDDASTDKTATIIKNYTNKYPDRIKPIYRVDNLYSQGIRNMIIRYLLPKAKGKYIALCEGDDYWTDYDKLQKQVDFLESNPDYSLCFHSVKVVFDNKEKEDAIYPDEKNNKFTIKELLKGNFIQTNSVMYKSQNYKNMPTDIMPGDWYLHLYHAQFGKIGFIDKTMAVYRRHSGGIWWDSYHNREKFWDEHGIGHLELYHQLLKLYGDRKEYKEIIYTHIGNLFTEFGRRKEKTVFKEILTKHIKDTAGVLVETFEETHLKEKNLLQKNRDIAILQKRIKSLEEELDIIRSSHIVKVLNKARVVKNKVKKDKGQ